MADKVQRAPEGRTVNAAEAVDSILVVLGFLMGFESPIDFMRTAYVTDLSCVGDFIRDETELGRLRILLAIDDLITPRTLICDLAERWVAQCKAKDALLEQAEN